MSKKRAIVICGPTATGKTNLAIYLAKMFDGEIISADSRQVYKGMDVGTGKGLDESYKYRLLKTQLNGRSIGYYQKEGVKIWGYDLVSPKETFSSAEYRKILQPIIEDIFKKNKLPIITGGTGFYINALVAPPKTLGISANRELRNQLEQLDVSQLQQKLRTLSSQKLDQMNNSDRNNPRRLIRAVEICLETPKVTQKHTPSNIVDDIYWVGLETSLEGLKKRVSENVLHRATQALTEEVTSLNFSGMNWDTPAGSATGYFEWIGYMQKTISRDEAVKHWTLREHQYQKRQLTWFKANKKINWFDCDDSDLVNQVADRVQAWYS